MSPSWNEARGQSRVLASVARSINRGASPRRYDNCVDSDKCSIRTALGLPYFDLAEIHVNLAVPDDTTIGVRLLVSASSNLAVGSA